MADELIDLYDENNKPLGVQKMKSEAHAKGLWHRTVHVWIYNSRKEILIQLRAKDKDLYPDKWDVSAAGHIGAGEDAITAAIREVGEELGLKIKKEDLHFLKFKKNKTVYRNIINNEFYVIYLLRFDGDIDNLNIQKEELQEIKFIRINELEKELKNENSKFVPHGEYWAEMIEVIKKVK